MESFEVRLSENGRRYEFTIDPEDAYLRLIYKGNGHSSDRTNARLYASVKITTQKIFEQENIYTIDFNNQEPIDSNIDSQLPEINDGNVEKVILELLEGNTLKDFEAIFMVIKGREKIGMLSPIKRFEEFLSDRINSKILFSAPFGSGKSSFLDHYFNSVKKHSYNVFTLFPVNYSVSSNEDIFTYIKADILLQLMATEVEFDQSSINFLTALEEYAYLKPRKVILSLLENISKVHPTTEILAKGLKGINSFVREITNYKTGEDIADKTKTIEYIKEIYEKEGSLFEDNFYSQLIRQLLEQLKLKTNKSNILIIEDLDRIDPDHIFRILNVISAHYDAFKFSDNEIYSNKFGFDKIIIVSDVINIENIFHHKYGDKTDFKGYINKFYSRTPFFYENNKQISSFIEEIYDDISKNGDLVFNQKLIQLLKLLHQNNLISLREIIKISTINFKDFNWISTRNQTLISRGPYTKALKFLIDFYGGSKLIMKFESLKKAVHFHNSSVIDDAKILLASLGFTHNGNVLSALGDSMYSYDYQEHIHYDYIISVSNIRCFDSSMNPKTNNLTFNTVDFYTLLIENIKRIVEFN